MVVKMVVRPIAKLSEEPALQVEERRLGRLPAVPPGAGPFAISTRLFAPEGDLSQRPAEGPCSSNRWVALRRNIHPTGI
jgi:hypothetical protein